MQKILHVYSNFNKELGLKVEKLSFNLNLQIK